MAWCCQATSHCLNQCWPRSMLPYGVTWPQWVNKPLFRIMVYYYKKKKKNRIKQDNGNYRNDDWVKIMWLVTRSEMNWWNTTSVFECCMFGFSLIMLQLFISWQWKQNHGYWSLNVFLYVLMVECYELMILCVCICKLISCFLFLDGTLTISRNFFKLKRWINQILMMKFLEILEANLKII